MVRLWFVYLFYGCFSFVYNAIQKVLPFSRIVQRLVAESAKIDDIICGFRGKMGKTIDGFCVKFHVITGDLYLSLFISLHLFYCSLMNFIMAERSTGRILCVSVCVMCGLH